MLINCVAYENGAKLADIPVEDISEYIIRPGCFVWVALADATPEELAQMQDEFNLHPLAVEDPWRWKTPTTATSGPRWRNTATPSSW